MILGLANTALYCAWLILPVVKRTSIPMDLIILIPGCRQDRGDQTSPSDPEELASACWLSSRYLPEGNHQGCPSVQKFSICLYWNSTGKQQNYYTENFATIQYFLSINWKFIQKINGWWNLQTKLEYSAETHIF